MIEGCVFCQGEHPLRHRLPFGNRNGRVLIVLPFDHKRTDENCEMLSEMYPNAMFMWRISCENPGNYTDAKLGCGIFVRWEVDNFDVVAVPKEDVWALFGNVNDQTTTRLDSGKVVIPYSNMQELYAEVKRADTVK